MNRKLIQALELAFWGITCIALLAYGLTGQIVWPR